MEIYNDSWIITRNFIQKNKLNVAFGLKFFKLALRLLETLLLHAPDFPLIVNMELPFVPLDF